MLNLHLKLSTFCLFILLLLFAGNLSAQLTISGTVYDSSKVIPVKDVVIKSSGGAVTVTDSTGHYNIAASDKDSLTFIYLLKPTARFAVKQITDIGNFDISLHIRVSEKFKTMKEVRIFSRSFKQDSISNRQDYAKIFGYQKPGIAVTSSNYSGAAGLDLDEFINIFRFKRNKQLKHLQTRLLDQEKENYINYRFNKTIVKRITHLEEKDLNVFMVQYRPDFLFTQNSTIVNFYQYILNSAYQFKKDHLIQDAKQ